jgi:tetratricopeptide (TPR) repeat protein
MGTPAYLAPEQALDARRADIRSDLYALGCTFYFLLTGRSPFPGPSLAEIIRQQQLDAPEPVTRWRTDVPRAVEAVVSRMMAKRPEDRYQEPIEVARALQPFLQADGERRKPSGPRGRHLRAAVLAGVGGAVVLAVAILLALRPWGRSTDQPPAGTTDRAGPAARDASDYVNRGRALIDKRDFDGAIAELNEAIRLDPENAEAYKHRGNAYLHVKSDLDRALPDLNEAVRLDPGNYGAHDSRGLAYFLKGDHDRALADFEALLDLAPKNPWGFLRRGDVYRAQGQYDRAIADYDRGLALNSHYGLLYYSRSKAYEKKGDAARARADMEEAVRIDPGLMGK